jgi:hypothetical protein
LTLLCTNVDGVRRILGRSRSTIGRYLKRKKLRYFSLGRMKLIPLDDVACLMSPTSDVCSVEISGADLVKFSGEWRFYIWGIPESLVE